MDPTKKTAFLLTEIAMDLLSNKFYDVDGNQVKDMESLHKYKCDPSDYLTNQRNLRRVLCISDVSFQAADNIQPEVIDLDDEESEVNGIFEADHIKSTIAEPNMNDLHGIIPTDYVDVIEDTTDNKTIDASLMLAENQEGRIKYIIDTTKDEFKKIKSDSLKRRNDFLLENIITYEETPTGLNPIKELSKVFYAHEKKMLETESEALISFIKIVKKTEFPSDTKESISMLNKLSSDIMKAKEIMCWNPKLCD